jgi:hypothetical protein
MSWYLSFHLLTPIFGFYATPLVFFRSLFTFLLVCFETAFHHSLKERRKIESESITFRIEKNILEDLHQESEQKMESINIVANQIFKS